MSRVRQFVCRVTAFATRQFRDQRLNEEIEDHLARQTAENLGAGLSPKEARRQAVLKFGALGTIKEEYRNRETLPLIETLLQDVRHALRRLRKSPGFTFASILTLALGIGATTSIFSLVHAVLLKSLPVSKPEELYRLGKDPHCCVSIGFGQTDEWGLVSNSLYEYLRDNTKAFTELAAADAPQTFLGVRRATGTEASGAYLGEFVSGNYFIMFGVNAYAGQLLSRSDDSPAAPPVAIMSYRLWKQRYGLDPSVVGGAFNINDKPFTIVGIAPPGFYGDRLSNVPPDFYLPLATEPLLKGESSLLKKPDTHWLNVIGRIGSETNTAHTEAQMRVELQTWLRSHIADMSAGERAALARQTLNLAPGGAGITSMRQQYGSWLLILMMVAAFVLLIVCSNIANLMLVRGLERRQQASLSMALGAPPSRIIRPVLTESILLSLLGGTAGVGVAFASTRMILHYAFETTVPITAMPSWPVLGFAFALSLVTGILFGMAPAWLAVKVNPIEALRGADRSTQESGSLPRKTLVVMQAALSVVLLSASGLLLQTLRNLQNQDLGFAQDRRIVVNIDPVLAGYKPEQLETLYQRIHDSLAALPGVDAVASALYTPQSGDDWSEAVFVQGRPAPQPNIDNAAGWARVTSGFFDAMGTPILRGRALNDQDTSRSLHVAVVSEGFAKKFFKNKNPLGNHFGKGGVMYAGDYEIVGVAKDARFANYNLDQPVAAFFYLPQAQSTQYREAGAASTEVRSHYLHDVVVSLRPGATLPDAVLRNALASVNPNLPIRRTQTVDQQVASTFSQQKLMARLTSLFGLLALLLASIGLYGVTSYSVGRRVNEIGVRMALGAERGHIFTMVLREAFGLIAAGLVIGVPLALATGYFLSSQLYQVSRPDPIALLIAVIALAGCAFIATIFPAFRASTVSPLKALRTD